MNQSLYNDSEEIKALKVNKMPFNLNVYRKAILNATNSNCFPEVSKE